MYKLKDSYHVAIMGSSGTGKTVFALDQALKMECAVVFFNVKHIELGKLMMKADGRSSGRAIKKAIDEKRKINFIASSNLSFAKEQLAKLWTICRVSQPSAHVIFIIDECRLIGTVHKAAAAGEIATVGRSKKVFGWFLMQRPAQVHKELITQADVRVIFDLDDYDEKYIRSHYGEYYIEALHRARKRGKYHFSVIENRAVIGTYKSKPDKLILKFET